MPLSDGKIQIRTVWCVKRSVVEGLRKILVIPLGLFTIDELNEMKYFKFSSLLNLVQYSYPKLIFCIAYHIIHQIINLSNVRSKV